MDLYNIPYIKVEHTSSLTKHLFDMSQLSEEQQKMVEKISDELSVLFHNEIYLGQIPTLIKLAVKKIDCELMDKDIIVTRNCITAVLYKVIDKTNTKQLPDAVFDPLFKYFIHTTISLLMPTEDTVEKYATKFTESIADTDVTDELIVAMGDEIIKCLKTDYINMSATKDAILLSIKAAKQAVNLDDMMRQLLAMRVFSYVIDKTDYAYFPDALVDPIIKDLYRYIIPVLI